MNDDLYSKYKSKRRDVSRLQQTLQNQATNESRRILFQESQIEESVPTSASIRKNSEIVYALRTALNQVDSSVNMVNLISFQYVMSPKEKAVLKHQQHCQKLKEQLKTTLDNKETKKQALAKSLVTSLIGPPAKKLKVKSPKKAENESPTSSPKFNRRQDMMLKDMLVQKVEQAKSSMQSLGINSNYSGNINTSSSKFLKNQSPSQNDNILYKAMKQELSTLKSNAHIIAQQLSDYIPTMPQKSLKFLRKQDTSRNRLLRIESSQRIVSVASIHSMVSGSVSTVKAPYKTKDLQDLRVTLENRLISELKEGDISHPSLLRKQQQSPTRNSMLKLLTDNSRCKVYDKLSTKVKLNDDPSEVTLKSKEKKSKPTDSYKQSLHTDSLMSMQKIKYKSQFQREDSQTLVSQRLSKGKRPPLKFKIETSQEEGNDDLKALFREEAALERRQMKEMKEQKVKRPRNAAPKLSSSVNLESTFPTMVIQQDEPNEQIRRSLLRLFNYQVTQLDEEAMCNPEAQEKLYLHLKSQLPTENAKLLRSNNQQPIKNSLRSYMQSIEYKKQEEDPTDEKLAREALFAFKNKDGTLKTDRSLQKLIDDEMTNIQILQAAMKPSQEEPSYESAAKYIFQKADLSYYNQELKLHVPIPPSEVPLSKQAALALLYRKDRQKDPQKIRLASQITHYLDRLQSQSKVETHDMQAKDADQVYELMNNHHDLLPKLSSYADVNRTIKLERSPSDDEIAIAMSKTKSMNSSFYRQDNIWLKEKTNRHKREIDIERFKEKPFDWNTLMDMMIEKFVVRDIVGDLGTSRESRHFNNPRYAYFKECRDAIEPAIGMLSKIEAGKMMLMEYPVSDAMCKGVMKACELDPKIFKNFFADNSNITDERFSYLLEGMNKLIGVNSIVIRRSDIGLLSAPKILPMCGKFSPNSLEELRIENCNISAESITILLEGLAEKNYIRRFALVGAQFDRKCVELLVEFINFSVYLEDLDLSMTQSLSGRLEPILEAISTKGSIKLINLSWNNLLAEYLTPCSLGAYLERQPDKTFQENLLSVSKPSLVLDRKQDKKPDRYPDKKLDQTEKTLDETLNISLSLNLNPIQNETETHLIETETRISGYISTQIDGNQNLQHIDISDAGLSEQMLRNIAKTASKSSSLLGIHFSGNPGLNSRTIKELIDLFNATWEPPLNKQTLSQFLGGKDESVDYRGSMMTKDLQQRLASVLPYEFGMASDQMKRHLIFTRVLGFELEMPGSEYWHAFKHHAKECWICERRVLTVVLWSPEFGEFETKQIQLSTEDKQLVYQQVFQDRETNFRRYRQREVDKRLISDEPKQEAIEKVAVTVQDQTQNLIEEQEFEEGSFIDDFSSCISSDSSNDFSIEEPQPVMSPHLAIAESTITSNKSSNLSVSMSKYKSVALKKQTSSMISRVQMVRGASFTNPLIKELPKILGGFNNWQPQPMVKLNRYCEIMDTLPGPDIFQECKALKRLRPMIKSVEEMTRREKQFFEERVELSRLRYNNSEVWSRVLSGQLKFKHPLVVGSYHAIHMPPSQVYFTFAMFAPGQNDFMVQDRTRIFLHQACADMRQEQLPNLKTHHLK